MVKKKTLADYRREVEAINKATSPQSFGKSPAPFLGQSSAGKKGTGSAMRKSVSSFDVSSSGVKDNLAPAPAAPQPIEPQDFELKSQGGVPAIDVGLHEEMGIGYKGIGRLSPVIVPSDMKDDAKVDLIKSQFVGISDVKSRLKSSEAGGPLHYDDIGYENVEAMPFSTTDADRTEDEIFESQQDLASGILDSMGASWSPDYAPDSLGSTNYPFESADDVGEDIDKSVSEFIAAPEEVPHSEAIEDVSQAAAVGAENVGEDDFDLIPEINGGTPFGGLPDALPAGPMLGGDMGDEAAPGHVPNEEMIERLDGAATSLSEYMEANTQILEELANSIQALMVRMRNVESQIARF